MGLQNAPLAAPPPSPRRGFLLLLLFVKCISYEQLIRGELELHWPNQPCALLRQALKSNRQLIEAAKKNRHGHRDSIMVLLAFRHGLRASELCDLR